MQRSKIISLAAALAFTAPLGMQLSPIARAADQDSDQKATKMEKHFFQDAASDNTLEIRVGKLALERSQDPQIKQAAQMMVNDHTQANQVLKQIADQNHIDVSTDDLNSVDSAEYDMIKDKKGDAFDRCFAFNGVGDHARDQLILAYQENHGSPPAREYATQVLPKIEEHLHALEQIARPMAGLNEATPAAEVQPGGAMNGSAGGGAAGGAIQGGATGAGAAPGSNGTTGGQQPAGAQQ